MQPCTTPRAVAAALQLTACGSCWGGCWKWTTTAMMCGGRWWRYLLEWKEVGEAEV